MNITPWKADGVEYIKTGVETSGQADTILQGFSGKFRKIDGAEYVVWLEIHMDK